jgi:hypothetical protein
MMLVFQMILLSEGVVDNSGRHPVADDDPLFYAKC